MRKAKKVKVIRAWAVVYHSYGIENIFGSSEDRSPIFNSYFDAKLCKWEAEDYYRKKGMVKIFPVLITPLQKERKRK